MTTTPPPAVPLVRRPWLWVYVVLVAGGIAVLVPIMATTANPDILAVTLAGAALQAITLLLWGWFLLPKRRTRWQTAMLATFMGAAFTVPASILVLNAIENLGVNRVIAAGFVEEPVKAVGALVVILLLAERLRGPLDGLVIGYFVGLGFAVIEDVFYTYGSGSVGEAWQIVITRLITQLGGHAIWTAIVGAALAYVVVSRGRRWSLLIAAITFSVIVHCTWNTVGVLIPGVLSLGITAIAIAVSVIAFFRVRRWSSDFEAAG